MITWQHYRQHIYVYDQYSYFMQVYGTESPGLRHGSVTTKVIGFHCGVSDDASVPVEFKNWVVI